MKRGLVAALLLSLAAGAAAQDRAVPYWASIASGEAMMRTGPARTYPGIWLFKRRDLPVKVVQRHENWRKIEDPDGIQGWMLVTMLSDRRTGLVKEGPPRDLHTAPDAAAPVRYRAEAGVVGRLDQCDAAFCRIDIAGKQGFIARGDLYGLDDGEVLD